MFKRAEVNLKALDLCTGVQELMWTGVNKLIKVIQGDFSVDKKWVSLKLSTCFPQEDESDKSIRYGSLEMRNRSYAHIHRSY